LDATGLWCGVIIEVVGFVRGRRETPEEARQRRLSRLMLGLPPETVYHHVREGVAAVAGLCLLLVAVIAGQLGLFATLAPMLATGALLSVLTPTVLRIRRRYRHVVAGVLVLTVMLGLLAAAVHRYGYPPTVAFVVGPTPSAIADAASPR
jgi:hypothetical protein